MAENALFLDLLKMKRRGMSPAQRARSRKQIPGTWLYPAGVERRYRRWITTWMEQWTSQITPIVRENYNDWLEQRHPELFQDQNDQMLEMLENLRDSQQKEFTSPERENLIAAIFAFGMDTNDFNQAQFDKFAEHAIGMAFDTNDPEIIEQVNEWTLSNYNYLRGMGEEYSKKVSTLVLESVQNGVLYTEVMKDLRKLDKNMSVSRAKLLARDQIGKLNGTLTKQRQTSVGIDDYVWATAGDERVRGTPGGRYPKAIPSHFVMNQKLCRWDDDSVWSTDKGKTWTNRASKAPIAIPGGEIQCRCTSYPWMEDIFEEIDRELAEEEAALVA